MSNMNDFVIENGVLKKYKGPGGDAVIPDGVTSIGKSAFSACRSLTGVMIPDSVTEIGDYAFRECRSLTSVMIPDSVTNIGKSAFSYCRRLLSVTIPVSVTSIQSKAFDNCSNLTSVNITNIAAWCSIKFEDNDSNPLGYAHNLYLNDELVTDLIIPDGVTGIGDSAFFNCRSLASVTIPDSVMSIGKVAFQYCSSLTSVNITNIAAWCSIRFEDYDSNPLGYAHNLYLNDELVTDLIIPDGVTGIGYYAFGSCNSLTSVTIPDSVTIIGNNAFEGCRKLMGVTIGNSVMSIGDSAFRVCSSLMSVTIGNSVTRIGDSAFYNCSSLASVTIPDSVTSIGNFAFEDCRSLTSVTIPDSVTSIGNAAFRYCSSLTSVNTTNIAAWCSIKFEDNDSNPLGYAHNLYLNDELVTDLIIPDGVTGIGAFTFENCNSLTSVTIPDSVTSIGNSAFSRCERLTSVTISDSVTCIGESAFSDCSSLKSVNITDIAAWCSIKFEDNNSNPLGYASNLYLNDELVTDMIIPDGVTGIDDFTFEHCSSLASVTIPDSVTSIGREAFSLCKRLKKMMIPASVRVIRKDAFERTGITAFEVSPLSKKFQAVNGIILSKDGKKLIAYPPKANPAICRLPETVEEIPAAYPFGYGGYERWFEIPRSVKKMAKTKHTGNYVFIYSAALIDSHANPVYLGDISVVKPKEKNNLVENFLHAVECGRPEIEPYKASYVEHIRNNPKSYLKWASENEKLFHFFVQEKLIPKNWVEKVLVELEQKNRSDLKAELLSYQQENFPQRGKDSFSLSDDDPELKRRLQMDKRREEIKNQKGIRGIAFVATGWMENFGIYNEYTNAMDWSDLKAYIEARGGFLRSAVSSKTDYLICNDPDYDSVKMKKAKELGVTIIDEKTFLKMAEE